MNKVEIHDDGSFLVDFGGYNPNKTYRLVVANPDENGNADQSTWTYYPCKSSLFTVPAIKGAGKYRITIFETKKNQGFPVWWTDVTVTEAQGGTAFVPKYSSECTEYVHWCNDSFINSVKELTKGLKEDYDKIAACTNRVQKIAYDYIKMVTNARNTTIPIPDLNECLKLKRGICWDCAPLLCGMLRALGFKTKLVVGTLNDGVFSTAHCWVEVLYGDSGNRKWRMIEAVKNNKGKKASAYHAEYYY